MTAEAILILVVRVLGSLPVLRWAFAGAVIAIVVDLNLVIGAFQGNACDDRASADEAHFTFASTRRSMTGHSREDAAAFPAPEVA